MIWWDQQVRALVCICVHICRSMCTYVRCESQGWKLELEPECRELFVLLDFSNLFYLQRS